MSVDTTRNVLEQVFNERVRQETKWGQQDHPDWSEYIDGYSVLLANADDAKYLCDTAFQNGSGSYAHILLEEVQEAFAEAASGEKEKLREELIQVAAVAAAWIEKLDRDLLPGKIAAEEEKYRAAQEAYYNAGGLHPCYD